MFTARQNACYMGLALLTLGFDASAVGVGVAVMNDRSLSSVPVGSTALLLPIRVTNHLSMEPFFTFKSFDNTEADGSTFEVSTMELGVGVFMRSPTSSNVSNYFGARISKISSTVNFETIQSGPGADDEYDATVITPLVGFDYMGFEVMTLGIELGLSILDGSFTDGNNANNNSDLKMQALHSAIVVRYFSK